uniref:Uncharacterized protein n=1 Tax=Rhizophora mucronata TaxID=61149 RepID=A0A2P2IW00_RHIMU
MMCILLELALFEWFRHYFCKILDCNSSFVAYHHITTNQSKFDHHSRPFSILGSSH